MGIKVRLVDQVAHEGNPRNSPVLTVEGVLDGDTNLDLLGPGGPQDAERIVEEIPEEPDGGPEMSLDFDTEFDCSTQSYSATVTVIGGTAPFEWAVLNDWGVVTELDARNIRVDLNEYTENVQSCLIGGTPVNVSMDLAYTQLGCSERATSELGPCTLQRCDTINWNCNDQVMSANIDGGGSSPILIKERDTHVNCTAPFPGANVATECNVACGGGVAADICAYLIDHPGEGVVTDVRTQEMIDNGCQPCILLQGLDLTVTVTDANNNTVGVEIHVN